MADISQIKLPSGSTYNIKDSTARDQISSIAAAGLTYQIESTLPSTNLSQYYGKVIMVPKTGATNDIYDEYLLLRSGTDSDYIYSWEMIGNTQIDLTNYVTKGTTSSSSKSAVTVSDHTVTQGSVSLSSSYTPSGTNDSSSVTITPSTTDIYSMTSAGSVTAGKAASFTNGTLAALGMTVSDEVLTVTWTAPTADTFSANTPTAVTLPGRSAAIKSWTGYTAATAAAQTFTGSATTISMSGKTTGVAVSTHSVTVGDHTHTVG